MRLSTFFVNDILERNTQFPLCRILTELQLCSLLSEHAWNWWGEGGKWDQVFSCRLRSCFVRTLASWLQVLGSATQTCTSRHCRPSLHPVVGSRRSPFHNANALVVCLTDTVNHHCHDCLLPDNATHFRSMLQGCW